MTTCEHCHRLCLDEDIRWRQTARETMSSPAEHEQVGCVSCVGLVRDDDEDYERAAAKYDGANGEKDWR